MITPQNIMEKTFEKAVFGGYDMGAVDKFLEDVSTDLALLQKENATLKAKMKVLVDKIEEYRSNEDAIRMAIVSAQRLGGVIENEARENAAVTLTKAQTEADRIAKDARLQLEMETARLAEVKKASAQFVQNMELLCGRQMSFLDKIKEMDFVKELRASAPTANAPAAEESVEIHETVKSIEETIAKVASAPMDNVHPDFRAAPAIDELPTRAFSIVTDPEDDLEQTAQFSFDGFGK